MSVRLHMIYFTTASLVGGALLSAIQPNLAFVDMLFLSTSAMTQTGTLSAVFDWGYLDVFTVLSELIF